MKKKLLIWLVLVTIISSSVWAESVRTEVGHSAEAELQRLRLQVEERADAFGALSEAERVPDVLRAWHRDVGRFAGRLHQVQAELDRLGVDEGAWRPTVESIRERLTERLDVWTETRQAARTFVKTTAGVGSIRGTVTKALDGSPVEFGLVEVFSSNGATIDLIDVAADGTFVASGLEAGTYFITAQAFAHRGQIYDGIECTRFNCYGPNGTAIDVPEGGEVTGIDFSLTGLGILTGRMTDASTGEPLVSQGVEVRDSDGFYVDLMGTDSDGVYRIILWPGTYFATTSAFGYQDEQYDDIPCPGGVSQGCEPTDGTPIEMAFETTTSGVDFALGRLGAITGRVVDTVGGSPLIFGRLEAWDLETGEVHVGAPDNDGNYTIGGLSPGDYAVAARNFGVYVDELYDDVSCFLGPVAGCDLAEGTPVSVGLNATTAGIDFDLDLGAEISGRVLAAGSAEPLVDIQITVFDATGQAVGSGRTDASGRYVVPGLGTGSYVLIAEDAFDQHYLTQLYDHRSCADPCDPSAGDPVAVVEGQVVSGIDFDLVPLGVIEGRITDADSGVGLNANVVAYGNGVAVDTFTDDAGRYQIRGLPDGEYTVLGQTFDYIATLYPAIPCHMGRCDVSAGQSVTAQAGAVASGIDIALPLGGSISGTVTLMPSPFISISVQVFDDQGELAAETRLGGTSDFHLTGLESGDHFVKVGAYGHRGEVWRDTVCHPDCDPLIGDPIAVQLGQEVAEIDFDLERLGVLTGLLTDADSGLVIDSGQLNIWDDSGVGFPVAFALYDVRDGVFTSDPLAPGTYYVTSDAVSYRDQVFGGGFCDPTCDPTTGTPIEVGLGSTVTGIDMALRRDAGIVGRVVDADSGFGAPGVQVAAWNAADLSHYGTTITGLTGGYSLSLNTPGEYYVATLNSRGGTDEIWDDVPCPGGVSGGGCELTDGDPITVAEKALTTDIDFALDGLGAPCQPSATTMCLNQGRFRVRATWRNANGDVASGRVQEITDDTGYFWFFDEDNVEVVVKVLDACVDPFDRFWVFAAGLTDVGVQITVTDVATGDTRTYENPLGQPFVPVLDADAFATCGSVAWTAPTPAEAAVSETIDDQSADRSESARVEKACVGTDDDLCLSDSRFQVEASWRSADGSGRASAEVLTDDTGYFWFFEADNVEVVVKVLDACAAPFNRYWVFAAGLTDVELTLKVIDTETGQEQDYENPLGQPFEPILDTDAFATCMP